jgi:hypothetical protein
MEPRTWPGLIGRHHFHEREPFKSRISEKVVTITIKTNRYIEPPFGENKRDGATAGVYNCRL